MVRRIALLVAYGPEARAFLQSGLADRLAADRQVLVVTAEPASAAFAGCAFPVIPLPCLAEGEGMLRLRAWGRGLRKRAPSLSTASLAAERAAGRWLGGGAWPRFLREKAINAVITASALGGRTLPALQAAANLGLPAVVLLNSWKDFAKRAELPAPVRALGAVTENELEQLPDTPPHTAACGSLHQAAVRRAPGMPRRAFCEALGLSAARPILCYAASLSDPGEDDRLDWLARRLPELPGAPQLLIRANPMGADPDRYQALADRTGVAVLRPRWEWIQERDWNCPLPEDLPWWRATLEHCAAAITLPSTITLDFAAWGKPVLNIVWGPGASLWSSDRHAAIRRDPATLVAASADRVLTLVGDLLRDPPPLARDSSDPADLAADLIRRALTGEVAPQGSRPSALEAAAP